jgi:hypothetical protein
MSYSVYEDRARELADELLRRQEAGMGAMSAADVGAAVHALKLKLRDITPPDPPYDQLSFLLDELGATVLIVITFKHKCLFSVGIFRELQMEYFG